MKKGTSAKTNLSFVQNKNPMDSGLRNFSKSEIKPALSKFRKDRKVLNKMPWWVASICLAVDKNRYSPDPLICAQINRGQHPGQSFGGAHA